MAATEEPLGALLVHLRRTSPLEGEQHARVLADVLAFFDETLEAMVRRRHRELQREGLRNDAIFEQLAREVAAWRFRAPDVSERQLRRMVYG
jgi:hypothetical protein